MSTIPANAQAVLGTDASTSNRPIVSVTRKGRIIHPRWLMSGMCASNDLSLMVMAPSPGRIVTLDDDPNKSFGVLRKLVALFCLLYFLGNLAIPGAILTGALAPHPAAMADAPMPDNN